MNRWFGEAVPELPDRDNDNLGSAQLPGKGGDPMCLPQPISCRRIRPRLCAAAAIEYRFLTLSIPVSQLRPEPPVSQRWAKLQGLAAEQVITDKDYDGDKIISAIEKCGSAAVIPPKKNRKVPCEYDKQLYKQRNQIERLFGNRKQCRCFATRY